jgi:hypothetical protein
MNKKGKKNFLPPSFRPSHMSRCYTSSSHSCFLKISGLQVTNITVLTIHVVRWLHFYAGEAEKWSPWPGSYLLEEEYKEMRSPCSWWTVSHHFHKHTWPWVTFILGLDFGFFFFWWGGVGDNLWLQGARMGRVLLETLTSVLSFPNLFKYSFCLRWFF